MRHVARSLCVFMISVSAAFTFNSAPQKQLAKDAAFLVESGKAGSFEAGATADEIYSLAGHDNVRLVPLFKEGMFEPALEIHLTGSSTGPSMMNMSFLLDAIDAPSDLSKVKSIWMPSDPREVRKHRCPQLGPLQ
jgi:hypothetical protein